MKQQSPPYAGRIIGVLGGMGPISSAHFYREVLTVCQRKYGAVEEGDYPALIIYSLPLKESTDIGFVDLDAALPKLVPVIEKIEAAGADFLVIPCNTAHCFFRELQAAVTIPIVSMIELVVAEAEKKGYRTLGLMGTETTVETGLYLKPAEMKNIRVINVTPDEQAAITTVIGNVTGGRDTPADTDRLRNVAKALQSRGADAVILGCTELPLAITQKDTAVPVLDSIGILAQGSADYAYGA